MLIHPGPLVKSKKAEAAQASPTASFPVRITPVCMTGTTDAGTFHSIQNEEKKKAFFRRIRGFVRLIPAIFHHGGAQGCPFHMDRDREPKTKEVDGKEWPASDFAYVPDPEKPSTWKLPIFNMHHVGGALAAMTSDYRGNPVEIPEEDRQAVMDKILARKAKLEREKE